MQNVSIHKASELPQGVKSAVEGRRIDGDEEVGVVAVPPLQIPPSDNRAAVTQKLEAFLNRRAEKIGVLDTNPKPPFLQSLGL